MDSAALIYFIEDDPRYADVLMPLFESAAAGERALVVSALSLLEVLVVPYRAADTRLAEAYETLLTRSSGVRLVDISRDVLRAAAQVRSRHSIRTPDAIQVATAVLSRCSALVTNDRRLPTIPGLNVVQLNEFR